jgi:hypothetical protein
VVVVSLIIARTSSTRLEQPVLPVQERRGCYWSDSDCGQGRDAACQPSQGLVAVGACVRCRMGRLVCAEEHLRVS